MNIPLSLSLLKNHCPSLWESHSSQMQDISSIKHYTQSSEVCTVCGYGIYAPPLETDISLDANYYGLTIPFNQSNPSNVKPQVPYYGNGENYVLDQGLGRTQQHRPTTRKMTNAMQEQFPIKQEMNGNINGNINGNANGNANGNDTLCEEYKELVHLYESLLSLNLSKSNRFCLQEGTRGTFRKCICCNATIHSKCMDIVHCQVVAMDSHFSCKYSCHWVYV